MGLSRRVAKVQTNDQFEYIELKDGSYYWYDRSRLYYAFFLYYFSAMKTDYAGEERKPVPDVFVAISRAKDREAAMDQVLPGWRDWRTDYDLKVCIDLDVLVEEGRIEAFDWVRYIHDHSPDGPHDYPGREEGDED